MKTTANKTVNEMVHRVEIKTAYLDYYIKISLDDDCHNGHNDFSITADIYAAGKPKTDGNLQMGGCCHDEILKVAPHLKPFIDLHLCDVNGAPMYAMGNGHYHLREGFNNTPPSAKNFKLEYCEYYRITPAQFDAIKDAEDEDIFAYLLVNLGIVDSWKRDAQRAIKLLEEMTGQKFEDNSAKLQKVEPKCGFEEIERRMNSGYYTPEKIKERQDKKVSDKIEKTKADWRKQIKKDHEKEKTEYLVKCFIMDTLGYDAWDSSIYYNHTNTVAFNWKSWGKKTTPEQLSIIIEASAERTDLPKGIKFEFAKDK